MDRLLQSYLGQKQIGEAQAYKNLTAFPVLLSRLSALDYITLDETLKQGFIEIAEIDKDGSVPELKFTFLVVETIGGGNNLKYAQPPTFF